MSVSPSASTSWRIFAASAWMPLLSAPAPGRTISTRVPRPLGLLILLRLLASDVGALRRPLHLQLAGLLQARVLEVTVDVERLPLGVQVLVADLDHGVLLDVVALLLARLDGLRQPRQALGVEGVRRVEELHRCLVELGE